ncbi:hypothetical protein BD560DRAFT_428009 [Blakeslea trispora]|nr:hypothetical protein BD560DRAFT_428009 [Blakeslea trispora]
MKIGSRDRQTTAILRGIEASERYAKETRDKIDILEQKIDMLQAIVKEQQALVEKIVTNDNMSQGTSRIEEFDYVPPAAMILRPRKSDCYSQKNNLTHRIYCFAIIVLDSEATPVDDEDYAASEAKIKQLSAYKEVFTQLANVVVTPLLPDYLRGKEKQELRALAVCQKIPINRCRNFWLEEDHLAVAYRNRARLVKPNVTPFGQGEPSYSADIDAVSSSVMNLQQVGDKRQAEEEDSKSSKSSYATLHG